MRTLTISALCGVSLALVFSSPAAAQSTSSQHQSPASLSQKWSFPLQKASFASQNFTLARPATPGKPGEQASELPLIQPDAQSGAANNQDSSGPADSAKDKAFAQLRHEFQGRFPGVSSACAHILIYVPPVTDTKMIIKVPGSDKLPENADKGRAVPNLGACGEDLRRVDAPHPAPSSPDGKPTLIPVHHPSDPH